MLAAEKLGGGEHGYFCEFFAGGGLRLLGERTGPSLAAYLPVLAAHHREHPGVRFCLEDPKGGPTPRRLLDSARYSEEGDSNSGRERQYPSPKRSRIRPPQTAACQDPPDCSAWARCTDL